MSIDWRYHFVPAATKATTTPGLVYLDVGGTLAPGVIDTSDDRQDGPSAAELLLGHREFVYCHVFGSLPGHPAPAPGAPLQTLRVTLVLRQMPDIDGVVTAWLARKLIEEGDLPPIAASLGLWATEIVQGRLKCLPDRLALRSPHLGYLAAMAERSDVRSAAASFDLLCDGLALLDSLLGAVGPVWPRDRWVVKSEQDPAGRWWDAPALGGARKRLEQESALWAQDHAAGHPATAKLPDRDLQSTDPIDVPCFVLPRASVSTLNKYWVRAMGCPYFICFYDRLLDGSPGRRVIVSLDPTWRLGGRRPDLRGLGLALEEKECEVRRADGLKDDRGSVPRWSDGSCDNADPWYDGRSHEYTLVESPYGGTWLEPEDVIRMATSEGFWEMPLVTGLVWLVEPGEPDLASKSDPLQHQTCESHLRALASTIEPPEASVTSPSWPVTLSPSALSLGGGMPTHVLQACLGSPIAFERAIELFRPDRDSLLGPGQRRFRHAILVLRQTRWHPQRVEGLLRKHLALDAGGQIIHRSDEVLYVDDRTLVSCRAGDGTAAASQSYGVMFLYFVYVRQTLESLLARFDGELARDVNDPGGVDGLLRDGELILQATNRFLSTWIGHLRGATEAETSTRAALSEAMQIEGRVAEVRQRSETLGLRLLRAGEVRQADRKEKADEYGAQRDRWLNRVLYLMAVGGVFQTYIAWAQWGAVPARHDAGMALVVVLAVIILVFIEWRFRESSRQHNPDPPTIGEKRGV